MIKFTKEEISLCKQMAEKYRKPLENFDLVIGTYLSGKEFIGYYHRELTKERLMKATLDEVIFDFCETAKTTTPIIPLWTISDCLEFLKERDYTITFHDLRAIYPELEQPISVVIYRLGQKVVKTYYGKTPLEACLKAVLAVLEEGK